MTLPRQTAQAAPQIVGIEKLCAGGRPRKSGLPTLAEEGQPLVDAAYVAESFLRIRCFVGASG